MKIGVQFPTNEIGNDPIAIQDFAQAADNLGYDSLSIFDHVICSESADRDPPFPPGAFDERHAFHEPMVLFGYLAGLTKNITLSTGILISPQRQTVLLAKQAAEISVLSGGRLRLAFGTGWNHAEYLALGVPYPGRGKRLTEQVKLLRQLWSGEVINFEGEFHTVERSNMLPTPVKPIPIYFGGAAPIAAKRAARIGDGFTFGAAMDESLCELMWSELEKHGRSRDDFGIESTIHYTEGPETHRRVMRERKALGGSILYLRLNDWVGYSGVEPCNFTEVQQFIDAMETFKSTVADLL